MKANNLLLLTTLAALTFGPADKLLADTVEADCQVYAHGDLRGKASGKCEFSQRQGYIDIRLKNGNEHKLQPGSKGDWYVDQNGKNVQRIFEGDAERFQWHEFRIIVRQGGQGYNHQDSNAAGGYESTPYPLRDLVGARAGQAEGEVRARGYRFMNSSKGADSVWTNWEEASTGKCVTIRTVNGHYESIIYVPEFDCRN